MKFICEHWSCLEQGDFIFTEKNYWFYSLELMACIKNNFITRLIYSTHLNTRMAMSSSQPYKGLSCIIFSQTTGITWRTPTSTSTGITWYSSPTYLRLITCVYTITPKTTMFIKKLTSYRALYRESFLAALLTEFVEGEMIRM